MCVACACGFLYLNYVVCFLTFLVTICCHSRLRSFCLFFEYDSATEDDRSFLWCVILSGVPDAAVGVVDVVSVVWAINRF